MTEPITAPPIADPTSGLPIVPDAPIYNASLVRRVDETESLAYFWVRFDGEPTPFEAGQYMTIGVTVGEKIVQRPYSVASPPAVAGTEGYEFYVRRVQGGTFTPLLFDLPVGHRMRMIGPKGKFMLAARRRPDAHLHLVGHGQRAVRLDDAAAPDRRPAPAGRLPQRRVVRRRARLPRARRGLGGVRRVPGHVRPDGVTPPATRPNAAWTGRTGRVEMILAPVLDELGLTPANSIAYICGNPDMILSAEETLLGRGYPEDQVHKELYWPKGKEPRGLAGADLAGRDRMAEANEDQ